MPAPRRPKPTLAVSWLRPLAETYLGPFSVCRRTSGGLDGYFFKRQASRVELGIFIGFLTRNSALARQVKAEPPGCVVYASVAPARSTAHARLVSEAGSLFRQTYDLLNRYTATRPRFGFYEEAGAAIVRHAPLASFPARLRKRYARNFFVESLALLVRTCLPDYLRAVTLTAEDERRR